MRFPRLLSPAKHQSPRRLIRLSFRIHGSDASRHHYFIRFMDRSDSSRDDVGWRVARLVFGWKRCAGGADMISALASGRRQRYRHGRGTHHTDRSADRTMLLLQGADFLNRAVREIKHFLAALPAEPAVGGNRHVFPAHRAFEGEVVFGETIHGQPGGYMNRVMPQSESSLAGIIAPKPSRL